MEVDRDQFINHLGRSGGPADHGGFICSQPGSEAKNTKKEQGPIISVRGDLFGMVRLS